MGEQLISIFKSSLSHILAEAFCGVEGTTVVDPCLTSPFADRAIRPSFHPD